MSTVTRFHVAHDVRDAAQQAALAPSIHNTQPWRFTVTERALEIVRDASRQLRVLDPLGRQLTISLGCALFNARVALAARGHRVEVQRFPDPARPELACRVTVTGQGPDDEGLGALLTAIGQRRTNRRRFDDEPVPDELLLHLADLAEREGAWLTSVTRPEHRLALAQLSRHADELENADPAYRAELRRWTTDDPTRPDGVPAMAVPHVDTGAEDDLPIRDFDTHGMGWLPTRTHSSLNQCLVLLGTEQNGPVEWLRAGEALERVLLQLTRRGYAASPLTQVIEVQETNTQLRLQLGLARLPHILLRIGRAPATPPVNRRTLEDMLDER